MHSHSGGSDRSHADTRRRRAGAAVAAILLTTAAGIVLWRTASTLVPDLHLVSPTHPDVRLDAEITAEFGLRNPVVWVFEALDGTIWTPAQLARLDALTRDVLTIPGVLASTVLSIASPNVRDLRITDDVMEPVYLMGTVPGDPAAVRRLRQRVEDDPNFRGTLVSEDGRAALVVADFRRDVDPAALAREALARRDRHRGRETTIWVVGAAVQRTQALPAFRTTGAAAGLPGAVSVAVVVASMGLRLSGRALLVALLTAVWTAACAVPAGLIALPWAAAAVCMACVCAVVLAVAGDGPVRRTHLAWGVGLAAGCAALGRVTGPPASTLAYLGALGSAVALLAVATARILLPAPAIGFRYSAWLRVGAILATGLALAGVPRLRTAFDAPGYGMRYLPAAAATDLRALDRLLPPPTALVVRFRGASGFMNDPAALAAVDAAAGAARVDTNVVRTFSLADIVKTIHRAFNGGRPEFFVLPDDRGLIARYLVLAYSPSFRQFTDRGFTRSALWIYLDSARPADLARVAGRLREQLTRRPVPGAEIDLVGGDGAVILAAAAQARRLAVGGLLLLVVVTACLAVGHGVGAAARAAGTASAAMIVTLGTLGWAAVPIDLVALPFLIVVLGAALACGVSASLPGAPRLVALALGIGVVALPALAAPLAGIRMAGALLLGLAAACSLAPASPARCPPP
jgi:hypothetical protein